LKPKKPGLNTKLFFLFKKQNMFFANPGS